jgi:hypothetical protein
MRLTLLAALLVAIAALATSTHANVSTPVHAMAARGQVCFDRGESNGPVDLQPVRLLMGRMGRLTEIARLQGGDSICVDLDAGGWVVEARSSRSNDSSVAKANECRSERLPVKVVAGETHLSVSPRTEGQEFACGWNLASAK